MDEECSVTSEREMLSLQEVQASLRLIKNQNKQRNKAKTEEGEEMNKMKIRKAQRAETLLCYTNKQ